ncbi:momilactone A synthase [Iris pallida]|uniref:Momilactone A synthase n=1 Tax=Iris pallida TaxID=29817 RepID=A0AAX6GIU7_IRIPA|nr:momilactone A synthase [Iris pallida]
MFNNAGITGPNKNSILDYTKSDMEKIVGVNLVGPFLGTKHAARVMIPAGRGCIISTSSTAAVSAGIASHGYTCTKHAVVGLTKNTAFELGRFGIRVNCVSPHGVSTPLATGFVNMTNEEFEGLIASVSNLKGVILKAEDVANAVLYLASDDAKYVSGQNLVVTEGSRSVIRALMCSKYNNGCGYVVQWLVVVLYFYVSRKVLINLLSST